MRTRGNKLPDFKLHFNMRQSRKEQKAQAPLTSKCAERRRIESLSNILRPAPNISNSGQNNTTKRGRTRLELIPAFGMTDFPPDAQATTDKETCESLSRKNNFSYSSDHSDYEVSCTNVFHSVLECHKLHPPPPHASIPITLFHEF